MAARRKIKQIGVKDRNGGERKAGASADSAREIGRHRRAHVPFINVARAG
jgi:hypothetical protein